MIQANNKLLSSKEVIDGNPDFEIHKNPTFQNGFISITKNKTKWWRCNHSEERRGKRVKCICIISNRKWEKLTDFQREHLKEHTHQFPDMERFLTMLSEPTTQENDDKINYLIQSLFIFIAESNISLNIALSQPMKDLLQTAVQFGQENPDINASQYFSYISNPKKGCENFNKFADKLKEKQIELMAKYKYVSIQIDAGKLGSKNYLETTISNFYSKTSPIPYENTEYFSGKQVSYKNSILNIIENLCSNKLKVAGIVADNLRVQWSALKEVQEELLTNPDKKVKSFLILPCSCHNLSLGINDSIKSNQVLSEACNCIIHFSVVFRKKAVCSILQKACPSYCETRWNCIYDIAEWIIKHFLELDAFFHDPIITTIKVIADDLPLLVKTLYIQAPLIVLFFAPFKTCSKLFEGDSIPMAYVFPYCLSAISQGRLLCSYKKFTSEIYYSIENSISQRMFHSKNSKYLYFLFLMSSKGRFFDMCAVRGNEDLDQSQFEQYCSNNFEINVDEKLIRQAKLMLNSNSLFHVKFEHLNQLHQNSELFSLVENEEETNLRKSKEEYLSFLLNKKDRLRKVSGFTESLIKVLQNELDKPMRFCLQPKKFCLSDKDDNEIKPLSHQTMAELAFPIDDPSTIFSTTNDFLDSSSSADHLKGEKEQIINQSPEVQSIFTDKNAYGIPLNFYPEFWKHQDKSILYSEGILHSESDPDNEEEDYIDDDEKLRSYFNDFELETDLIDADVNFHEAQILEILQEICALYKLDHAKCCNFFLGYWRNAFWDDEFRTYNASFPDDFQFWQHLKQYGPAEQKEFAKLALHLITILASEASVERIFSQKRLFTTGTFANTSNKLANSRMTIKWYAKQKKTIEMK